MSRRAPEGGGQGTPNVFPALPVTARSGLIAPVFAGCRSDVCYMRAQILGRRIGVGRADRWRTSRRRRLGRLQEAGRHLAASLVALEFEADFLTLVERDQVRTLDGGNVNEYVSAAIVGLDEAEAFGRVEPLYSTNRHYFCLSDACMRTPRREARDQISERDLENSASSIRKTSVESNRAEASFDGSNNRRY